ncbi:MAG: hypothetical protein VX875_02135 [Pseudomonadota bacterium]|jgi:hypothetical protein|nr:hypothetical protein [Pseudomonadota bacterium]
MQTWESVIVGVVGILFTAILIGLLLLKSWARVLYVYGYFPLLLIYLMPSSAWSFMTGIASIFSETVTTLWALIWDILIMPSLHQPLFSKQNQDS